jgi:hypothetical protein
MKKTNKKLLGCWIFLPAINATVFKTVVKRTVLGFLITQQAEITQVTIPFKKLTCIEFLPGW